MKNGDVCGRVDSSGFAVLLAHNGQNDSDAFLFNLQTKIDDWYSNIGKKYPLNYSYGMLENSIDKYDDLVDMLKAADTVMYSEKRKGR